MSTGYWDDTQRDEGTIERVSGPHGGYYDVTLDSHIGCGVKEEYGVEPKVGDRMVIWGGFGYSIRGQAINDRVLFYRTPDEQRVEDAKQREKMRAERIGEYEGKRAEWDGRVTALSEPLRKRVEDFRAFKGDEWRWSHEPYEVMCCEEATKIAAQFKTGDAIREFSKMEYAEQKAAFPTMGEGHSGNSWSFSVRLAWLLIERPDVVPQEHGALCGLVGCEDYGCYAARSAEARP